MTLYMDQVAKHFTIIALASFQDKLHKLTIKMDIELGTVMTHLF